MTKMRPIDELPDAGTVEVHRNQSMTWLRDGNGVEYIAPPWLASLITSCWECGYREAQEDIREALGIEPQAGGRCERCEQGVDGKKAEVAHA